MNNIKRGQFEQILFSSINERTQKQVRNLFREAAESDKIDEHGNWEFAAEFDKKGRGYAINWDLYDIGFDRFTRKLLIVIQIRKWEKRTRNAWPRVHKSYFLIGRNEDNTSFAHPVSGRVIYSAIKKGSSVIESVQRWIFGCDYKKVIRQGDVALIPCKKPNANLLDITERVLKPYDGSASHKLLADKMAINGNLYSYNTYLEHVNGVHPPIQYRGWAKVVLGKRADFYDFAAPTTD